MTDRVRLSIDGPVAIVTLDRPAKRNALDLAMFEALTAAGKRICSEPAVRACVLEGEGDVFCAGIDLTLFEQARAAGLADLMTPAEDSPANLFQRAAWIWREVPVPVIAAIKGAAFGGGLQLALGADLRYAAPDTRFAIMEVEWGIIPDMALSAIAPRLVAVDRLKELAWTGRIFGAPEAEALGIVTALDEDPGARARSLAAGIAAKSPDAVRAIKRLLDAAPTLPAEKALRLEAELQATVIGKANQREAVEARLQSREPEFTDPAD